VINAEGGAPPDEEIVIIHRVDYSDTNHWDMPIFDQLTGLEGRINRLRYLLLSISSTVVYFVYIVIVGVILFFLPEPFWTIVMVIFSLPFIYVQYAIVVKRLKDTGRGGGWITYTQVNLVLVVIYMLTPVGSDIELIMDVITALVGLPLGIVCLFFRGDEGKNEFGPDPLGNVNSTGIIEGVLSDP